MNELLDSRRIIEELEGEAEMTASMEPSEPPVSDSAVGADTEGDTALGLLRDIKELLTKLATALAPEPEEGGEEGPPVEGGGDMGTEGEVPLEDEESAVPPPESDENVEVEDDEEDDIPNRRPEPVA